MVNFLTFCKQFASPDDITTEVKPGYDIPVELEEVEKRVVKALDDCGFDINNMDDEDIYIDGVTNTLSDMDNVINIMSSCDIPDALPNRIALDLAGVPYNALTDDQKAIIKTLTAYIIVSVKGKYTPKNTTVKEEKPMSTPMKSHLTEIPVKHARISSSDVVAHLQDLLGFGFDCDFILCDNRADWEKPMTTNKCYVIMRTVFRPEDITVEATSSDYADRILKATGAATQFKQNVIKTLEPFMFPENMAQVDRMPEKLQQLAEQGIAGSRLDELKRRPRLFYDQVNQRFGLYLRPECIIKDIVARHYGDENGVFKGVMGFGYLSGDNQNAAAITWGVNIYENMSNTPSGVTIDAVFAGIKA